METAGKKSNDLTMIATILLLAAAMRGVILFTGQRWLRSDEAVVGLMAKHIFTRGERPIFLYGQSYGGGHAIVAYLAAPMFAAFGRSPILLTGISASLSVVNIWLVWLILKRLFGGATASLGAALYAFSPPVVYQSFLINGGTETFLLALMALHFFLRSYMGRGPRPLAEFLAGAFGGLAYWGMDYALLYPAVFVALWLISSAHRRWGLFARFTVGFLVGCSPLVIYNLTTDFAHVRMMFQPAGGPHAGLFEHFSDAIWGLVSGDLAAFFGGDIDEFRVPDVGAAIHALAATIAVAVLVWRYRRQAWESLRWPSFAGRMPTLLTPALVPVVFILAYLAMYGAAKFSLPGWRTPRYLLPLCPFVSMAIAVAAMEWKGKARAVCVGVVAFLVLHGAVISLAIGMRPWHDEHNIRTWGKEVVNVAEELRKRNIHLAFAPYEIQWRLMFETDESVLASSVFPSQIPGVPGLDRAEFRLYRISPLQRYPAYETEVVRRVVQKGEDYVFIFRSDFHFAEWAYACGEGQGAVTGENWGKFSADVRVSSEGIPVGKEFVIYPRLRR